MGRFVQFNPSDLRPALQSVSCTLSSALSSYRDRNTRIVKTREERITVKKGKSRQERKNKILNEMTKDAKHNGHKKLNSP